MIIGIDLGTTNSLAAYFTEDGPKIIPNRLGKNMTPSVVSIDEEDQAVFEEAAKAASDYAWDLYIEQLASDVQFMKDEGLTVTELSDEDREVMLEKIQPVYDYLESQYEWVPEVREMIDNIE